MAERQLPLHVFHFDCFWMKAFQWCDFEWDPATFPDPKGMLQRLKARGLKICVWINPYIGQKSPLFHEGKEKGYLLKRPDGRVWQWDKWQAGMGIVDFTNPEASAWYAGHLKRLVDMGVDCFKTDFGERIPTDVVWHDGCDPQKMHNHYAFVYNKLVYETLQDKLGASEAVLFARSASVGAQQFPVHWGGDCYATYESMAESLRGACPSACLVLDSGATTSAVSKTLHRHIFINAGALSGCSQAIAACMAANPIVCLGFTTMKPATWYVSSHSLNAA